MPRTKRPSRVDRLAMATAAHAQHMLEFRGRLDKVDTLLKAMNLRASTTIEHQNDLFRRIELLEKTAKQSPSDRCLFARVRAIEERLRPQVAFVEPRCEPSARERFLETENKWLREQLLKTTR